MRKINKTMPSLITLNEAKHQCHFFSLDQILMYHQDFLYADKYAKNTSNRCYIRKQQITLPV